MLSEFIPILKPFYKNIYIQLEDGIKKVIEKMHEKFNDHLKDYNDDIIRDFCDALINAKNKALSEGKESASYLTDQNLAATIFDLFLGMFKCINKLFIN